MKTIQSPPLQTFRLSGVGRVLLMLCSPSPSWQVCALVRPLRLRALRRSFGHSLFAPDSTRSGSPACWLTLPTSPLPTAVLGYASSVRTSQSKSRYPGTTPPHCAPVGSSSPHTGTTSVIPSTRLSLHQTPRDGSYSTTTMRGSTSATATPNPSMASPVKNAHVERG